CAPPVAPSAAPPGTMAAGSPLAASPGQPSVGPVPGEGVTMEEFSQLLEILGKLFLLVSKKGNPPQRPGV
ncbi:MAG: hypothetical protein QME93_04230, partial [Bacillota bacterium]|nr:hypothetical protein [Bacillota bacterium]